MAVVELVSHKDKVTETFGLRVRPGMKQQRSAEHRPALNTRQHFQCRNQPVSKATCHVYRKLAWESVNPASAEFTV